MQSELNEASHKQRDDTVESLPQSRSMKVTETGGNILTGSSSGPKEQWNEVREACIQILG